MSVLKAPVWLRRCVNKLDAFLVKVCASNGFLASLYYTCVNTAFYREHRSVLEGRIEYDRSLRQIGKSCAMLRRNIHRLEKGLIMRPRRDVFAEDYIAETIDCYTRAIKSEAMCTDEKKWATDVLLKYFEIAQDTPTIAQAREKFSSLEKQSPAGKDSTPYPHSMLGDPTVNFEEFRQLCVHRRSVRWFQAETVSYDLIERAVAVAALAPSACNRQPFMFKITNDPAKAVRLAKLAGGTGGYDENIQCIVAVVGNLDAYPLERDRHLIYIDGSLASMQLMLALESLGLSSCPINWPDIEVRERRIDRLLDLRSFHRVIMLIAVGYADPDGGVAFSQKKGPELLMDQI